MISESDAIKIARDHLENLERELEVDLSLLDGETIGKSYGWIFFYNSKDYLETGDFRDMLTGNAPFIVNKGSGEVCTLGTAEPLETYLAEYEEKLN